MHEHVHHITVWAAFIAGLAGSMHCVAMCGGMAGALGMRARSLTGRSSAAALQAMFYQSGRIGGYMLAGAISGAIGATLQAALDVAQLGIVLRIVSGIFIALVGLKLLTRINPLAWIEKAGARFWTQLRPAAQSAAKAQGSGRALLLGFLWGWLPCGLVYSMLLFASMSASPWNGAAIMLAFGLGTLPSMLTSSMLAAQLQRTLAQRWPKIVSGTLLIGFGAWMTLAPLLMHSHAHH